MEVVAHRRERPAVRLLSRDEARKKADSGERGVVDKRSEAVSYQRRVGEKLCGGASSWGSGGDEALAGHGCTVWPSEAWTGGSRRSQSSYSISARAGEQEEKLEREEKGQRHAGSCNLELEGYTVGPQVQEAHKGIPPRSSRVEFDEQLRVFIQLRQQQFWGDSRHQENCKEIARVLDQGCIKGGLSPNLSGLSRRDGLLLCNFPQVLSPGAHGEGCGRC